MMTITIRGPWTPSTRLARCRWWRWGLIKVTGRTGSRNAKPSRTLSTTSATRHDAHVHVGHDGDDASPAGEPGVEAQLEPTVQVLVAELRALRAANTVLEEWCAWVEREARGVLEQSTFATLEAAPMVDTESLSHALDALSAKWRGEEAATPPQPPEPPPAADPDPEAAHRAALTALTITASQTMDIRSWPPVGRPPLAAGGVRAHAVADVTAYGCMVTPATRRGQEAAGAAEVQVSWAGAHFPIPWAAAGAALRSEESS